MDLLVFQNSSLGRIKTSAGLSGNLDGYLNIEGSLDKPQLYLELNTQNGEIYNHRFSFDTRLLFNNNKIFCQKLDVDYHKYKLSGFRGSTNVLNGESAYSGSFESGMNLLTLNTDFSFETIQEPDAPNKK